MGARNLPPGYFVEDGRIVRHWSDKQGNHTEVIADGTCEVIAIIQYNDVPDQLFLAVRFTNSNGTWHEVVLIPVKQTTGNGKKLLDSVPDWFVLLGTSPTKRLSFVQQTLNLQRAGIKEVIKVHRVGLGYHVSEDGTLFYAFGNAIINPPPNVNIEATSPFHLRTDPHGVNIPHGPGVSWVRRFCEQGPPQAALFTAIHTAYIRPILESTNNPGRFGIYVLGESGTGKSETAKLLCQIFSEESGATLSSDKADIFRLMATYRDMPFLVDDLNNSHIASGMNKKRERLSEVLQQISGTGTLSIRGETFDVGSTTPIITAESLLTSPSTVNRCLVIAFDKAFSAETMSWLQDNHGLYLGFLSRFVEWLCQNHSRLIGCVQNWQFSNLDGGRNPEAFVGFHRLMRTFKILKITVELLLLYLHEIYAVPHEDKVSWRRLLEEGINQSVFVDTLEHLRKDSKEQERFYVDAILNIFSDEDQRYKVKDRLVAKSFEKYVELNKRASIDARIPRKIFFESDDEDYYCFRGDDLIEYLTAQYSTGYRVSKKAVSRQLAYHGLLQPQTGTGDLSYPITQGGKQRFYHLRQNVVEQLLAEQRENILRLGFDGNDNGDDQKWIVRKR